MIMMNQVSPLYYIYALRCIKLQECHFSLNELHIVSGHHGHEVHDACWPRKHTEKIGVTDVTAIT